MSCDACAEAEIAPYTHGGFEAGCDGCYDRSAAKCRMDFFESRKDGRLTDAYKHYLQCRYGDTWKTAHERVKLWAMKIEAHRESMRTE